MTPIERVVVRVDDRVWFTCHPVGVVDRPSRSGLVHDRVGNRVWVRVGERAWDRVGDLVAERDWLPIAGRVGDRIWGRVASRVANRARHRVEVLP